MRVSEIRVKQIRVNQGLGVHLLPKKFQLSPLNIGLLSKTVLTLWYFQPFGNAFPRDLPSP
jgi:hypothetical protein